MKFRVAFMPAVASILSLLLAVGSAEPVQYCKFRETDSEVDFCVGILMHYNSSTSFHDLYLTVSVTRPNSTSLGWTAVGLGETMEGALMFIVYGDPVSSEQPIVSIRKSIGHKQPTLVTREDMNGADLRVIRADWVASTSTPGSAVALVSLVCYSCHFWPGTEVSVSSKSQPWMWAWNSKQDIQVYTYDAHLQMHAHHAGAGGWGNFYVDMPRSVNKWRNAPSFPPIRPGIKSLGVGETPGLSSGMAWLKHNPILHLHGTIMGAAFILLFPIGVLAMWSGNAKAFEYHWIVQVSASSLTVIGFIFGLMRGRQIDTVHQVLGISVVACLGIQSFLGWRHHVIFLRIRRRTWLSHSHIWLGRLIMIGGWSNILTGMVLRGYSSSYVIAMASFIGCEAVGLTSWLWWVKSMVARVARKNVPEGLDSDDIRGSKEGPRDCFVLGDENDNENDEDASSMDLGDEEARPMMERS